MQPPAAEDTGTWVHQLCSQLGGCLSVEDVGWILNQLNPSFLSIDDNQIESVIRQLQVAAGHGTLTELILACS